jgi:holo-[acyl-carrier protein] synthase
VVTPVIVGVGIDLVELDRVRSMLARREEQALRKLLTEGEREYIASRPDPVPHVAARIAAKEAVYKALQTLPDCRGVSWQEIEVWRALDGRPLAILSGRAAAASEAAGGLTIHLSLTHSATSAAAVAVLERPGG